MRLLAFLLITTEIFILFNLADGLEAEELLVNSDLPLLAATIEQDGISTVARTEAAAASSRSYTQDEKSQEVIKRPRVVVQLETSGTGPYGGHCQPLPEASELDHRSSTKLLLNDNVVSSLNEGVTEKDEEGGHDNNHEESASFVGSSKRRTSKTNPLIESASTSWGANDNMVAAAATSPKHKRKHKSRLKHKHEREHKHEQLVRRLRLPTHNQAKNVLSPLFGDENHKQRASMTHLRHKYDWWCHRDCNINSQQQQLQRPPSEHSICASDGRLYSSMCELRRQACLQNVHLFKRPRLHCPPQMNGGNESARAASNNSNSSGNGNGAIGVATAATNADGGEEVRIVELKRRCNRIEYEDMKLLLLREFNGDTSSMFKYFDWNGDGFIEAHELWPRRNVEANKLMYAQVWDDSSSKCQHSQHTLLYNAAAPTVPGAAAEAPSNRIGVRSDQKYRLAEGQSKCWFFLDFAFEPQYAPNPCSLSHLMLFDLKHPSSKFNLDLFEGAFSGLRRGNASRSSSSSSSSKRATEPLIQSGGFGHDNRQHQHGSPETVKRYTRLNIGLGESSTLSCLQALSRQDLVEDANDDDEDQNDANGDDTIGRANKAAVATINNNGNVGANNRKCFWSRYNLNLAALQDPHISIEERTIILTNSGNKKLRDLTLELKDAQLYLSGQFKCACHFKKSARNFEHIYTINVLAEPRVSVRPHFQWSLPSSRISFECHYDYIDTSNGKTTASSSDKRQAPSGMLQQNVTASNDNANSNVAALTVSLGELGQFGLKVKWLKNDQEPIVDSKKFNLLLSSERIGTEDNDTVTSDAAFDNYDNGEQQQEQLQAVSSSPTMNPSESSLRASITMASSRLTLESLRLNDTGQYICRIEVPATSFVTTPFATPDSNVDAAAATTSAPLLYSEGRGTLLVQEQPKATDESDGLIYASGTYLWMFHDNGISIYKLQNDDGQEMEMVYEFNGHSLVSAEVDGNWNQLTLCGGLNPEQVVICEWSDNALRIDVKHDEKSKARKYIYVGQPNLNRIIVLDGLKFEIVAIINTEPQPRKLHLYKPSKIHLSKWVRHRLSPTANARFLSTIGTHAHPLKLTPDSKLYSTKLLSKQIRSATKRSRQRRFLSSANQMPSTLIQHDIWLLCYGQPLIVDPAGDEHLDDPNSFYSATFAAESSPITANASAAKFITISHKRSSGPAQVQPFTPRLTAGQPPFAWSIWPNKEAKLRNRKSVHIIQSTFFPQPLTGGSLHTHENDDSDHSENNSDEATGHFERNSGNTGNNKSVIDEFKRSTVITTHHVFAGIPSGSMPKSQRYLNGAQFDLIQDLTVPPKPYSLETNDKHKIHYAYVTHYDDRRLFRVSMDEYRYDREIDLQNCDAINLITTAQGLLVIQCRAPITHNLIGQLVLDQLTSSRIEFNVDIRAQESYLSPDNRYLISIYSNSTTLNSDNHTQRKRSTVGATGPSGNNNQRKQSIIYVQLVTVSGLKLQYEIKTSLEISQCSFVWKDGYYAAIFVSTNRRDQQSEILSLRLADSRLELMARVPGLINAARHKDQLVVSPELRLAALSTNQGTYVVDLEDNRVSQSLRRHQSSLTLLWA